MKTVNHKLVPARTVPSKQKSNHIGSKVSTILLHVLLILASVVMFGPFLWMAFSGLKDLAQIFQVPPTLFPNPWRWENISRSLTAMPFDKAYINSAYISVIVVLSQLLTCSMAAFSFAKIDFPFRNVLFILFLSMLMVPEQVTIVPLYIILKNLGWLDTHLSLIVPDALFSAFGVFLLRQFFMGIPRDLSEAAYVDGASMWKIYWRIMVPLIRPALASLAIVSFLGNWNSFFKPVIFLSSTDNFTVPLMLSTFKGLYVTDWTLMMSGSAIAVMPVLLVYLVLQRNIIEGISMTGIKG
ncbi:multiple sugar transport system permease protein [Paenibacillus sp. V4I3]|uniref:carbohydrate ABC transporter permease n=1 Tax=unclassified Paenibacillus TaxID=185978 RepID=UPI00278035F6|nr:MULTISPECIES: carbohydrate ABC transporter permease [unclassified Paenibacillus]MDQ0877421.1 multiple sugar transport system permease protein [Paenibacillus sp. V4I3]MDQ0886714.1 multiple sugar transport system permease protein [Paenibacillus sp. V4I9]